MNEHDLHGYLDILTERLPQLVWTSHDSGMWVWASRAWGEFTGQTTTESAGVGWQDAVHPDDRAATVEGWAAADASGELDITHRLMHADSSNVARWFHTRARPLPAMPGRPREWLGTCVKLGASQTRPDQQSTAEDVFQRRMSKVLALIRDVTRRTVDPALTAEGYAAELSGRLDAIARHQAMLRTQDAHVQVAEFVLDALLAHAVQEGETVTITGPTIYLESGAAELFGLAVYEMATNAVEHGALSPGGGTLAISWRVDAGVLRFDWRETSGKAAVPSTPKRGLGMVMIKDVLKLELGAMTMFEVGANGMHCALVLPARCFVAG